MKQCRIVEDLLPLYEEQLVQQETAEWINEHLAQCESCRTQVNVELPKLEIIPKKSAEQMIQHIQYKLMLYQLLFVILSFLFAMTTTIFSEKGFVFILSYFILGIVVYAFYQRFLLTLILAFVPIFIWSIYDVVTSYPSIVDWYNEQSLIGTVIGGIVLASIHTLFAVLGVIFVVLIRKVFEKE